MRQASTTDVRTRWAGLTRNGNIAEEGLDSLTIIEFPTRNAA